MKNPLQHASYERNSMDRSIQTMAHSIADVLNNRLEGFWLYGSTVLQDFRPGWSDIDFIALSKDPISEDQAERLLHLRQTLCALFPDDPYYSCFEGGHCLSFGIQIRAVYKACLLGNNRPAHHRPV